MIEKKKVYLKDNYGYICDLLHFGWMDIEIGKEKVDFCNFEPRQAQYYLSACIYLNLINEDLALTEFGASLFNNTNQIKNNIYYKIITDEIIGKIFAKMILFNEDVTDYAYSVVKEYYPEYSDAVIIRRISTIKKWCAEIKKGIIISHNMC